MRSKQLGFMALVLAACGGGSGDGSGSSGSSSGAGTSSDGGSGGGSSGAQSCDAECFTGAVLTLDADNSGGRLEGATVESCHLESCVSGVLSKRGGAGGYELRLESTGDAGTFAGDATVSPLENGNLLRIRVTWVFGFGGTNAAKAVDGDTFTLELRTSEGEGLASRSFTAKYEPQRVCGSTCNVYESEP